MRILLTLLSILLFSALNAQDTHVFVRTFQVHLSAMKNGKIYYYNSQNDTTYNFGFAIEINPSSMAGRPLQVEAYAVFARYGGSNEYLASGLISLTKSNFNQFNNESTGLLERTFTLKSNDKEGTLKFKYRYKTDLPGYTDWTPWKYSTQMYEAERYTPPAPAPNITGPSQVCTEEIYTVQYASSVTLENATGIATLSDLGNGQWKVTKTGEPGEVILKATNGSMYYNQTIKVGTPAFSVLGSNIIDTGNWIFDVDNPESIQDVVWSISAPNNTVQLTPFDNNKSVKVTVSNWSYFGNNFFNLHAKITSTCGEIIWSSRSLGKKGDEEYADQ